LSRLGLSDQVIGAPHGVGTAITSYDQLEADGIVIKIEHLGLTFWSSPKHV